MVCICVRASFPQHVHTSETRGSLVDVRRSARGGNDCLTAPRSRVKTKRARRIATEEVQLLRGSTLRRITVRAAKARARNGRDDRRPLGVFLVTATASRRRG